jgi:LPS-assembly lipoprotein
MKRTMLLIAAALTLSGCGLQPLYSGGNQGAVAQSLGGVEVQPIPERAGWLMTNALSDRIAPLAGGEPQYRLVVELDDRIEGFGVRADDSVTRERRSLRARYQLVRLSDGAVVLDATAGSDAGVDVVSSEFATVAAEDTALENLTARVADQIIARLSLFARAAATE